MANLGKKWTCFSCSAKFYDFTKPEALCPKCGANQKEAPAKPKAVKKEKVVLQIDDDFVPEPDAMPPGTTAWRKAWASPGPAPRAWIPATCRWTTTTSEPPDRCPRDRAGD